MPEHTVPVETVLVNYRCDTQDCEGTVIQDPNQKIAFMTDPIQFPHICDACGRQYTFTDKYPKIAYRHVKE